MYIFLSSLFCSPNGTIFCGSVRSRAGDFFFEAEVFFLPEPAFFPAAAFLFAAAFLPAAAFLLAVAFLLAAVFLPDVVFLSDEIFLSDVAFLSDAGFFSDASVLVREHLDVYLCSQLKIVELRPLRLFDAVVIGGDAPDLISK